MFLISWLLSPFAVILEPPQNKVWHCFHWFSIYFHEMMGPCRSSAPAARESPWRDGRCWPEMMQPLSFLGLHIYFKLNILFYIFTKALGQRFDIFSSPWPRFVISINHCCPTNSIPASAILLELALLSIIYFLCVLYLTCDYIVAHTTFLSLFLIFLNPVCP